MKIELKQCKEGETVWASALLFRDITNKPIRRLTPTECLVHRSGSRLVLLKIGKDGKPTSKIISYNSHAHGIPDLPIFTIRKEAIINYRKQVITYCEARSENIIATIEYLDKLTLEATRL